MVSSEPYRDLSYSLRKFKKQVTDSIPYAIENFPAMHSPEEIFKFLKAKTTYKNDPKGIELFQSLPTLLDNNYHGVPGAGDCDCFTIAALATLIANGFTDVGIVLAGRNPNTAKHIYAYVMDGGKRYAFDLTNKVYNYERPYPYKQYIPYQLNQQEKNMLLQLADGPPRRSRGRHPYIHFPKKNIRVREDYFDNMPAGQFQKMLLSEGIPQGEIETLSFGRAQRKARKEAKAKGELTPRQKRKIAKKMAKPRNQRLMIKAESKAEKRRDAGQSKIYRSQRAGGGGAGLISFFSKFKKPDDQSDDEEDDSTNVSPDDSSDTDDTNGYQPDDSGADYDDSSDSDTDDSMQDLFMGEADLGFAKIEKPLLILGSVLLGSWAGHELKKHKRRRAA